jgi:hypothetical protein
MACGSSSSYTAHELPLGVQHRGVERDAGDFGHLRHLQRLEHHRGRNLRRQLEGRQRLQFPALVGVLVVPQRFVRRSVGVGREQLLVDQEPDLLRRQAIGTVEPRDDPNRARKPRPAQRRRDLQGGRGCVHPDRLADGKGRHRANQRGEDA